jgi:CRP/FNR family cyclic AMP-dependent transcriptional regulator
MSWTLLRHLPDHDRRRIMQATTRRRFARGEVVFHEGDVGDALHLISRGRVAVRASTPMGEIATFAVLGPGDFFGEQALVSDGQSRTATVIALEPLETLAVGRATFEELRAAHPSVERFLVDVLAAQVRRLSTHLLEALFLPAEKRVARRLVVLADEYGAGTSDTSGASTGRRSGPPSEPDRRGSPPVLIPLTQEHLATLAGTTRPTVNRVLREMQDDGALRLGRGRVEILDLRAIRRRAFAP